jgi:hypothetical protein
MRPHHPAKRPYVGSQPSIASYLVQSPSTTSPCTTYSIASLSIPNPSPVPELRSPPLPPSVQSNLLSVGMRVRKSVPEGYKTGAYSAFALYADPAPATPVESPSDSPRRTRPRARVLTPFCGILKVGGMAQQQWGIYNGNNGMDGAMDDDTPPSSQGSTISDVSIGTPNGGNKRRFFDEEDEEEERTTEKAVLGSHQRVIAIPRRKGMTKLETERIAIFGRENMNADMDFEEADFLDYGHVGDQEMGGL